MKSSLNVIVIGLALALTGPTVHAMSELTSISVTPLWPTNSNPGNTVRYEVRVERQGQGMLEVELSSACMPAGCQVSFETNTIRFTGREPQFKTVIMSVTGDSLASVDTCDFRITAKAQRESIIYTNTLGATASMGASDSLLVKLIPCDAGNMEVRGMGKGGKCYRIESTTDLLNPNWTSAGPCTADANGRFTYVHCGAQSGAPMMRFYRAVNVVNGN